MVKSKNWCSVLLGQLDVKLGYIKLGEKVFVTRYVFNEQYHLKLSDIPPLPRPQPGTEPGPLTIRASVLPITLLGLVGDT